MVKSKRDAISPRRKNTLRPLRPRAVASNCSSQTGAANIRVVVRVRPPNQNEQGNNRLTVNVVDNQMLVFDPKCDETPFFYHGVAQRRCNLLKKANKDLQFVFDKIFGFEATNEDVFKDSTQVLIQSLMNGYNCSVFAYGATGAGKTYTMLGYPSNPGITYLTMAELFKEKEKLMIERDFDLAISYLEVYNELVQDLLNPGSPLQLREDSNYGVMVAGIKIHKIDKPDDLFNLLEKGNKNRTQHPTDANAESSRSHAVFQVYIQMKIKASGQMRTAKLSMIDLAGSERGSATGYVGARFTEGANINKSLLALGNCINSLADGQRHVPYRDSKLTRLLKDSLGGNCQTVMIANISPSTVSYEDTYNTLKYATRAKKIKSNMKKNVVNVEMHVSQYVKLVEELTKENERLKKENGKANKENEELKSQLRKKNVPAVCASQHSLNDTDPNLLQQVQKLFNEMKELIDRMHQIECNQLTVTVRRQLKEEADGRLSGLCIDPFEKEEGHKKLGNNITRCQKQETSLKDELARIDVSKTNLRNQIDELVRKHPSLTDVVEKESSKLSLVESNCKMEHLKRERDLFKEELKSRGDLLEKMSYVLQPCYMQIRGHGFATDNLIKDYNTLVSHLKGIKTIKWNENLLDSGLSSGKSSTDDEARPIKRKLNEDLSGNSSSSLDTTFTVPSKSKVKVCADQVLAKVYKPPPPKRLAKNSPRYKETVATRKPFSTVDHNNLFPKSTHLRATPERDGKKTMTTVHRPPFRR